MRNKILLFPICCLLLIFNKAMALDLDAPAEKKITVKSEIKRGEEACSLLGCKSYNYIVDEIGDCCNKVIESNKQKNTDTEAFLLGAYFGGWVNMDTIIDAKADIAKRSGRAYNEEMLWPDFYFKEYRKRQQAMGISDDKLCDACEMKCNAIKPFIANWAKKIKEK